MSRSNEPQASNSTPRTTVLTLLEKRRRGEPITMLTAYDFPTARAVDESGVDAILVGDSLAMVVLGHPDTLGVTMEEMLHHCRAVSRGAQRALLVGDMPFMSYQADVAEALRNAGRFLKEGGMHAVKLEGGRVVAETVRQIVAAGIPVLGHVGLTPQSRHVLGGFRVQGRTAAAARGLLDDALALEEAGCFAVVIESVPAQVAAHVTRRLGIPTIGIGAGADVDGQVLVLHDMLGLFDRLSPRFVKRYAELGAAMREAAGAYRRDVEARVFPGPEHAYTISDEEWRKFARESGGVRAHTASFGKRG
jgi:3-methyl-2-oxobutanoate hydroxymethyltransferase